VMMAAWGGQCGPKHITLELSKHKTTDNIRLKKAAQLLTTQGMNVTDVMKACGFSNSASFSTVFKKYYGMSPLDYMHEHEQRQ